MQSYNLLNQEERSFEPPSLPVFAIGRTVGILLLLQLAAALTLPFILSKPITLEFNSHGGIKTLQCSGNGGFIF